MRRRGPPCLVFLALLGLVVACRSRGGAAAGAGGPSVADAAAPPVPFEVREDSADLVFSWFDDRGNAHGVGRVAEVPAARRDVVRVDPPSPSQRVPGWVYVVDLRAPGAQGRFPVRSVRAEQLGRDLAALTGVGPTGTDPLPPAPPSPPSDPRNVPAAAQVIIYGASWCGACHQAAAWLRSRHVAYVERDIERDPGAAEEMSAKARRAGIPTGSIPIIDVRGRIMQGFDPGSLERALAGG